jgi:3',5'-cyclic AMP phosphodiesterase CpdA
MNRSRMTVVLTAMLVAGAVPLGHQVAATGEAEPVVCSLDADDYVQRRLDPAGASAIPDAAEPILRFVNLSDTHIIDDEANPVMTGNYLEALLDPTIGNNSAQRLQEEFTDEVLNAMISTINACHDEQALSFMLATGDLTDNATLNELRRYIDNLGGTSGHDTAFETFCGYLTHHSNTTPKAGAANLGCPIPDKLLAIPTGKLAADSQAPTPEPETDPAYAARPAASLRQIAETFAASVQGGSQTVAPGLPPSLRCRSRQSGCANAKLAVPHFAVFGNHDGYARGTLTFQQPFQAGALAFGRYFLESQREFINEYFFTAGRPVGHGFQLSPNLADDDDRNDGYYAFNAKASGAAGQPVRVIVLNTIADGVIEEVHADGQVTAATGGHLTGNEATNPIGLEMGVMDPEQFGWLQAELAAHANKPVLVFSHHADNSFSETRLGFTANGPSGVTAVEVVDAIGEHGNVVAWIAGHTHRHRIRPCTPDDCNVLAGSMPASPNHGFWRVETSSLVDYPQEGRIVEVFRLPGGAGYALKLTTLRADPNDPVANRALELSIAEENCSTAALLGGAMSSGPYNQERLEEVLGNIEHGVVDGQFCAGDVENDPGGPQGQATDRDTILLP